MVDWTPDKVKKELPDVQLTFNVGQGPVTITCVVRGRKEEFATVKPFEFGSGTTWEFSWYAIARSLNTGTPLKV